MSARIFKFNQMSVKMFTMPFVPASEKQKKRMFGRENHQQ